VRTNSLIAIFIFSTPAVTLAETRWEAYLRTPTSEKASSVQTATYSTPDPDNRKFEADLAVLEYEVAAGNGESTKLAVRLRSQFDTAAAILEYLDAVLGRSIRPNPAGYLQAILGSAGCPGAIPSGDFFVDRMDARAAEAHDRANALRSVKASTLRQKRDECIAILERPR